jgi:hypothetical protein
MDGTPVQFSWVPDSLGHAIVIESRDRHERLVTIQKRRQSPEEIEEVWSNLQVLFEEDYLPHAQDMPVSKAPSIRCSGAL